MDQWHLDFEIPPIGIVAAPLCVWLLLDLILRRHPRTQALPSSATSIIILVAAVLCGVLLAGWADDHRGLLLCILGALCIARAWRRYAAPAGASNIARRGLAVVRAIATLALLAVIAQPVLVRRSVRFDRLPVRVLIDQSASLQTRDLGIEGPTGEAAQSRIDALAAAFVRDAEVCRRLAERYDVTLLGFADRITNLAGWSSTASGPATALSDALAQAAEAEHPPAAIVLISDGAENVASREHAIEAAARWAESQVPIFAVGVGDDSPMGEARRIDWQNLDVPEQAPLDSSIHVNADLAARGLAGIPIAVELLWNDSVVARHTVRPQNAAHIDKVRLSCNADAPGFGRVKLRATALTPAPEPAAEGAPAPPRPTATIEQFVHVYQDKLNVMLIESHPRHEAAFLSRALAADPRFRLTSVIVGPLQTGEWTNPLPRTAADWRQQRVIILGDVPASIMTARQREALAEAVTEHGAGLISLGGIRHMQLMRQAPLNDLSPFVSPRGGVAAGDVHFILTPAGRRMLLRAGPSQAATQPSENIWREFPALSAPSLGALKPTAEALAASDTGDALLAWITAGKGRVVSLSLDATWRWSMLHEAGAEAHAHFWRQLVMMAAQPGPSVYVRTDRPRYESALLKSGRSSIVVEARVADPLTGGTPAGVRVTAAAQRLDSGATSTARSGGIPILLQPEGDAWRGNLSITDPGEYEIVLSAEFAATDAASGHSRGPASATCRFTVQETDLEKDHPEADLDLLRQIAETTAHAGGRYYPVSELGACLRQLLAADMHRRVELEDRIDATAELRWPLLLLVCGMLCLEWMLRKRAGFL